MPAFLPQGTSILVGSVSVYGGSQAARKTLPVRATYKLLAQASHSDGVGELLRESLQAPPPDTNEAYRSAAGFLRSQGFVDQEEVNRVLDIAMNPNSLHRSFRNRKRSNISSVCRMASRANL